MHSILRGGCGHHGTLFLMSSFMRKRGWDGGWGRGWGRVVGGLGGWGRGLG